MAKNITQRISLDGGKQIESQLKSIGDAGAAAFQKLRAAADSGGSLTRLAANVEMLRNRFAVLGTTATTLGRQMTGLNTAFATTVQRTALIAGSVGAATAGFTALVKSSGNIADDLEETSAAVGTTAERFSTLRFAFEQNGVAGDKFAVGLRFLVNAMNQSKQRGEDLQNSIGKLRTQFARGEISMEQFTKGTRDLQDDFARAGDVFAELGIRVTDAQGNLRDTGAVVTDIAARFQELPNATERAAKSMELFGSRNSRFVNAVSQGADAIAQLEAEARRVAPPLTALERAAGQKLNDTFDKLSRVLESVRAKFFVVFSPALTRVVDGIAEAFVRNRDAILNFARTLERTAAPIIADIILLLEGRRGEIAKDSPVLKAFETMESLLSGAASAVGVLSIAFKQLVTVLDSVAAGINSVFGTNFTGTQILAFALVMKLVGAFGLLGAAIKVIVAAVPFLGALFTTALAAVPAIVSTILATFSALLPAIASVVAALASPIGIIAAIGAAVGFLVVTVIRNFGAIRAAVASTFAGIGSLAASAWEGIKAGATAVYDWVVAAFTNIGIFFATLGQAWISFFTAAWEGIKVAASDAAQWVADAFNRALESVKGYFTSLRDWALGILKSIGDMVKKVVSAVSGAAAKNGKAAGGPVGFAGGGAVRGRGTATSDSIWARLSNGEFVQRTKAVRKYGAQFMSMLNNLRIPAESVRALMSGGFASGGLVSAAQSFLPHVPRYAMGGLVDAGGMGGSGRAINFVLDGQKFPGQMSDDTVGRLQRHANAQKLRATGRRPAWVR